MLKSNKDCNSCVKNDVCGHVASVRDLCSIGTVAFNCNHYAGIGKSVETEPAPKSDERYKDMSVDEVSKILNPPQKKHQVYEGTCEICGKENTVICECDVCGKRGCTEHFEFDTEPEERIDIETGDVKEVFYCKDCFAAKKE